MAGLVPAIHVFGHFRKRKGVDARHKAGHDEFENAYDPKSRMPAEPSSPPAIR